MEDMDPSMFAKSKPGKAGKSRYNHTLEAQFSHTCPNVLLQVMSSQLHHKHSQTQVTETRLFYLSCYVKSFRDSEKHKELATLEAQVYRFVELLSEQRAATRENIQRKQAQTGELSVQENQCWSGYLWDIVCNMAAVSA